MGGSEIKHCFQRGSISLRSLKCILWVFKFLREFNFCSALFAVHNYADEVNNCADSADDVGCRPGHVEADLGVHYIGDGDKGVECAGDKRPPCILCSHFLRSTAFALNVPTMKLLRLAFPSLPVRCL